MALNRIDKNLIDPELLQEVQDTSNKIGNLSELKTTNKTDIVKSVNEVTTQLADTTNDVSSFGAIGNGVKDDTLAIQMALDKGGVVTIRKAGSYVIRGLKIGSNTSLILGGGVKLVLKNGTSDYMIRNKGDIATPKYRDKNITIYGGEYNFNSANNQITGAYMDGLFSGHGILLHKVDGLRISNIVKAGNALKYVFLLADVTNVVCENGYIDNDSDGIHMQPPLNNIRISNWSGYTGDNFVAFTTGDYRNHTVSEDGNGENILVENIYLNDPTRLCKEPIRFVGAGKSNLGFYDNVVIRNIVAKSIEFTPIVALLSADQTVPNDYLKSTRIKKIEISGLTRLNASPTAMVSNQAIVDSLDLSNIILDFNLAPRLITVATTMKNLRISNINAVQLVKPSVILTPIIEIGIPGSSNNIVKNLTIEHVNFEINATNDFSLIQAKVDAIDNLTIDKSYILLTGSKGYLLDLTGAGFVRKVNISNSKLTNIKNVIKTNVTLNITNCDVVLVGGVLADLQSVGTLRVVGSSSFLFTVSNLLAPGKLSVNSTTMLCGRPLTDLSPIDGDVFNLYAGVYSGLYGRINGQTYQYGKTVV